MDPASASMLEPYRLRLHELIERGQELRSALAGPSVRATEEAARTWQEGCSDLVSRLSGGSKGHWLARAYGDAFLVRGPAGGVVEQAPLAEIVGRVLDVLRQAAAALSRLDQDPAPASPPRRFDFVQDRALRAVLESAYAESRQALEQGRYDVALITSSSILEAIITEALGQKAGRIADWPFEARIAAARREGLIGGGCARLPPAARRYRDPAAGPAPEVSEREARAAAQVLHVIMKDLDPGR